VGPAHQHPKEKKRKKKKRVARVNRLETSWAGWVGPRTSAWLARPARAMEGWLGLRLGGLAQVSRLVSFT
jgi:hypothetical protein